MFVDLTMSVENAEVRREAALSEYPDYDLDCLFDDGGDPAEVTVFYPEGQKTASAWITADVETAIPLSKVQ